MTGYLVFTGCMIILIILYLAHRKGISAHSIECMIFGGESVGTMGLTCSVFAAWMWTTSVFGSAETYALFGIWGPITYVLGACIAFAGLIGMIVFLRRHYPKSVTWLEFIQVRYGRWTKLCLYLFAVIVPAYVLIEQGVGIAFVLETFYGSSFRIISFLSVVITMGFVLLGGMKLVIAEEKLAAAIIIAGFLVGAVSVFVGVDVTPVKLQAISMTDLGLAGRISVSAVQYFILAIIIAFGQIAFDPAYYLKASMAKTEKKMVWAYLLGGIIIWGIITLAASIYMGYAATAAGNEITDLFRGPARAVFSFIIIIIGISTIAHFMIGMMGVFSTDLYSTVIRQGGSEREKIIFGRVMLIAVGLSCASMTIALENISLLTLDVFCAIFFAAPCVPLVFGCISQRNFGRLPVMSTIAGIIGGLIIWPAIPFGQQGSQLAGVGASLLISLLIMLIGCVRRMPYDR